MSPDSTQGPPTKVKIIDSNGFAKSRFDKMFCVKQKEKVLELRKFKLSSYLWL